MQYNQIESIIEQSLTEEKELIITGVINIVPLLSWCPQMGQPFQLHLHKTLHVSLLH